MRILLILIILCGQALATPRIIQPTEDLADGFAIVIDSLTFSKCQKAVTDYRDALQQDELATYIVIDTWDNPQQVRRQLISLKQATPPIEGAALIGEIPVAMIRDAQHMTSAFKIDQQNKRFGWQGTSVPSDRYYDDFDLQFQYLKQDTANALLHYFALTPQSPQTIECDIYTGRIKPPIAGNQRFEMINRYLEKVVAQKKTRTELNQALVYTGHGYHSEALDAWAGSLLSYEEQFPQLFRPGGNLKYYNHAMGSGLKSIILRELQRDDLDLAIFHAHGATDTQYLLGFEPAQNINQNIESIRLFLRSKLRTAKEREKSLAETKMGYMERHGVPLDWFEGAFTDSVILEDSLLYASQDIHVEDIRQIETQPRLVVFDECFNGSFIHTPYIAGEYVFGTGRTIAGIANSVNVLQDIWSDEFLGLINYGVRIGNWQKLCHNLESHIIGDPTFRFNNRHALSLNRFIARNMFDTATLAGWAERDEAPVRALAVYQLFNLKGSSFSEQLSEIYRDDRSMNVRMQALNALAELRTERFESILFEAGEDPSEFVRRMAVNWMGDVGKSEYIPVLARLYVLDPSDRVRYNAKDALEKIDPVAASKACIKELSALPEGRYRENRIHITTNSFERSNIWLEEDLLNTISDTTQTLKKRIGKVRTFRNYRFQQAVDKLVALALDEGQPAVLRATILEALGWYRFSYRRSLITGACNRLIADPGAAEQVKQAAIMTRKRINSGLDNSVSP